MEKEKVTLSIDKQVVKEARHYCVDHENMQLSSLFEQAVKEKIKKQK